jgi:calcineurin-like phosphoesterase family protein
MSESVWFTSDTHFGHRGILTLGHGRPFDSVEEMDEAMIERWNAMVKPSDRIYHLGDFSFHGRQKTREVVGRLNGRKFFVRGNHDSVMDGMDWAFEAVYEYKEIKYGFPNASEQRRIVLFHFPIQSWHQVGRGSWHLHGHCHGNLPQTEMARQDVGVDTHDFYPWHVDEIAEAMKDRIGLPGDHHG